jgi:predicted  nucleic acid-binding Zn-ribbon protein
LNQEHQQLTSELNERYSQLETKLNHILSEKSELENELDSIRLRMQTTESTLNEKTNEHSLQLEQTINEFEVCVRV